MFALVRLRYGRAGKRELRSVGALSSFSIGRAPDNTVVIDDPSIADYHAQIYREASRFSIVALADDVQLFVTQQVVPVGQRAFINGEIFIGKVSVLVKETSLEPSVVDSILQFVSPFAALVWPPHRSQQEAVLSCVEESGTVQNLSNQVSPEEAQELWERLSTRELIPQEWLFSFVREFRLEGHTSVYPLSIRQAASFALSPQAIVTAELLIPDLLYAMEPWGILGARHIVWSISAHWLTHTTLLDFLCRCLVGLLPGSVEEVRSSQGLMQIAFEQQNQVAQIALFEWWWSCLGWREIQASVDRSSSVYHELLQLPRALTEGYFRDFSNPFEPIRRLAELGVQVKRLSADSDEIELCLIV